MDLQRAPMVTGAVRVDHLMELGTHDMADDADEPRRPDRQPRQIEVVVAGVPDQVGLGHHPGRAEQVALGVLDGDDPRMLGELDQRVVLDRHPRAPGDVVEHGGQAGRVGDGREVADEALLRGLVVVRRHHEQAVRAGGLGLPREFQGVLRVVGSGTGDDHGAVADRLDDRAQKLALLFVARRRRLAGRPVDDQAVVAPLVDQVGREARGAVVVDAAVGQERGDHGGQHPSERSVR